MMTLANLWCRAPQIEKSTCPLCDSTIYEILVHIISECMATENHRERFISDMLNENGISFSEALSELDSFAFTPRLLGAPIEPLLEGKYEKQYLSAASKYVVRCLYNLL